MQASRCWTQEVLQKWTNRDRAWRCARLCRRSVCGWLHRLVGRVLRPWMPIFLYAYPVTVLGAILLIPALWLIEPEFATFGVVGWTDGEFFIWFLLLALVAGLLGHTGLNTCLRYISPLVVSVSVTLEPVLGSIISGWLLFDSGVPAWTVTGGLCSRCGSPTGWFGTGPAQRTIKTQWPEVCWFKGVVGCCLLTTMALGSGSGCWSKFPWGWLSVGRFCSVRQIRWPLVWRINLMKLMVWSQTTLRGWTRTDHPFTCLSWTDFYMTSILWLDGGLNRLFRRSSAACCFGCESRAQPPQDAYDGGHGVLQRGLAHGVGHCRVVHVL